MATAMVIGAQWGDEGKGKIVDYLAAKADVVVRSQGGNNAGHTVVTGGKAYVSSVRALSLTRKVSLRKWKSWRPRESTQSISRFRPVRKSYFPTISVWTRQKK